MHWSVNENTVTRCCNPVSSLGAALLHSPIQQWWWLWLSLLQITRVNCFFPCRKIPEEGLLSLSEERLASWLGQGRVGASQRVQGGESSARSWRHTWKLLRQTPKGKLSFFHWTSIYGTLSKCQACWVRVRVEDSGRWGHGEKALDAKLRSLNLIPHARENHQKLLGRSKEGLNIQE